MSAWFKRYSKVVDRVARRQSRKNRRLVEGVQKLLDSSVEEKNAEYKQSN